MPTFIMPKHSNIRFIIICLLVSVVLYYGINYSLPFQKVSYQQVKIPSSSNIKVSELKELHPNNHKKPDSAEIFHIDQGCVADPSSNGEKVSNRTHIPQKLENAYLLLDEHLDRFAPLKHQQGKWMNERPEGVAAVYLEGQKINFLWHAIQTHVRNCRTVCEVGLNAGHSSVLWLTACPQARAVLFDMPYKSWSQPAFDFLRAAFGDRVEIIEGNSLDTLPKYIAGHPDWQCDVIAVDGSNDPTIRLQDLNHFHSVAHPETLLLLDDASYEVLSSKRRPQQSKDDTTMANISGDLNDLYASLFWNGRLQLLDACSIPNTAHAWENSTISAKYLWPS